MDVWMDDAENPVARSVTCKFDKSSPCIQYINVIFDGSVGKRRITIRQVSWCSTWGRKEKKKTRQKRLYATHHTHPFERNGE